MYAHVTTYRLGTSEEVNADRDYAEATPGAVISDQSARTIASWWHSPGMGSRHLTLLSHGLPFDTVELRDEIEREIAHEDDFAPLLDWLDALEAHLTDGDVTA